MRTASVEVSVVIACGMAFGLTSSALSGTATAQGGLSLPESPERAAVRRLIDRFTKVEKVERSKDGTLKAIYLRGLPGIDSAGFRMVFDAESQRVVEVRGNRAAFTNDEWTLLAPLTELRVLSLHHNFGPSLKNRRELYDGGGLVALKDNAKLEEVTLPGSPFGADGLKAIARLPQVKGLGIWHVDVEDADFAVLREHPNLEWVRIAPMWSPRITDRTIEHLSHAPNMKRISLNEGYVTWENGLRHLLKLKGSLEELRLERSVVDPVDLERFQNEMPHVQVEHAGLAVVGELIRTNFKGAARKLPKWVPQELLERYIVAAEMKQDTR